MELLAVGFGMVALVAAGYAAAVSRVAMREAKSPRLAALAVEYQEILDEWLAKQNAIHARAMKRQKVLEEQLTHIAALPASDPASGDDQAVAATPGVDQKQALRARLRSMS